MDEVRDASRARRGGFVGGLALLAVSLLLSLGLGELLVRTILPQYRAVRTDRAMWSRHDLLGWITRPGVEAQQSLGPGHRVRIETNSLGFREREVPFERNPGATRVLVLGDSFAFGFGVEVEERFSELLARAEPGLETVNLGVSGYSTDQELLVYREFGRRYAPDIVILTYVANDPLSNASAIGHGRPKPWFAVHDGELALRGVPVPDMHWSLRVKYFLGAHSALYNLARERLSPVVRRSGLDAFTNEDRHASLLAGAAPEASYDLDITRRLLERLHLETQADGARLLVVMAISTSDLGSNIPENVELLAWCEEAGLACVDTYEDFRLERERRPEQDLFLPDRHHWNAAGHVLVSSRIRDTLRSLGWIGGAEQARSRPERAVERNGLGRGPDPTASPLLDRSTQARLASRESSAP